jgi:hypothetical protein
MRRINSMLHVTRVRVSRVFSQFVAIAAVSLPSAGA